MPWSTPTLADVRSMVRDFIRGTLPGADATIPNSVLRVISDAQGGMAHLNLQYIDWLALQLLPDTAETVWLDRHGAIWLVNSDNTIGRKISTFSQGTVSFTGFPGSIVPAGAELNGAAPNQGIVTFQTTEQITIGSGPTPARVIALDPGIEGNLLPDAVLQLTSTPVGVDSQATVIFLYGGNDPETDDDLRARVLQRIQQPPMGGDAEDYVAWTLAIPGVTRGWSYPQEMGIGTVTVRFMADVLRAYQGGFPTQDDVNAVKSYLDTRRPVTVKDFWVEAPIPFEIEFEIENLVPDTEDIRGGIAVSVGNMIFARAIPGQTIFRSWIDGAISNAPNVDHYKLLFDDTPMPSPGHLAVLGTIIYGPGP
jgi:uncharacterized phage protein gp47/JayE